MSVRANLSASSGVGCLVGLWRDEEEVDALSVGAERVYAAPESTFTSFCSLLP